MHPYAYTILIPLLPLAGFVLLGLAGKRIPQAISGWLATVFMCAAAVLSLYTAFQYFFVDGLVNGVYPRQIPMDMQWLSFTDNLSINMQLLLDPISVMMLVVVTLVSLMVHWYSTAYMKGEARYSTFFAYLQLFTFSMLGLVLSGNLFQIYIFWELVGVSSFLLIGFYFEKPSAVAASKKAFIVTRFADLFFLIGILITGVTADSFDFGQIISRLTATEPGIGHSATFLGVSVLTWALTLIFIGGAGKSAMFPLHVWLPDAMEGPTPVSALIHAATMVVAGVFLVARLFPVYAITGSGALEVVAYVGIFSALFAAIIACTQFDIKRVLAYSTMSQIGFMMFALGVSDPVHDAGYTAGMFHLFTHAFFKSLLFLGAGVVIHAVHSNDMRDMGALRKHLPVTHSTFLIGCLAIAGVPPLAGFFSKEGILHAAYETHPDIYIMALVTSGLTAFYMFRLYFSIFWNTPTAHLHNFHGEGSIHMKLPLIKLAFLSVIAGFVPFAHYVTATATASEMHTDLLFSIAPVGIGVVGILIAMSLYRRKNTIPERISRNLKGVYSSIYNKFYIDELYQFITKKIIFNLVGRPAAWIDRHIVDGAVNFTATVTEEVSDSIKDLQSGKVQAYAMYFFAGVVGLGLICLYIWL